MAIHIGRRKFIVTLSSAAAWPLATRAQQPATPLIGFLDSASFEMRRNQLVSFHRALSEAGYIEGRSLAIEYRYANGQYDRLPAMATELVRRSVTVMVAGGPNAALAAKAATATIPIVFEAGIDPVKLGLVTSFNRPGGNVTGMYLFASVLETKRLELARELAPQRAAIAFLANPTYPGAETQIADMQAAARALGQEIYILKATNDGEIDAAFTALVQHGARALLVGADPFFNTRRDKLIALAASHAVPTIYNWREYTVAGGLMNYGTNLVDVYRQLGEYTSRILRGANPSDLPVLQPTKLELVINLKTAKALGLEIPPKVLALADEVIE
jgi:putative ABC transport system substrate-binding protein